MRAWLLKAPWWALALVMGTYFGTFMALWTRFFQGAPWPVALGAGVLGGLFFGLVMGPFLARRNRRLREALGEAGVARRAQVVRAAWRGPMPEDPELREAARRVALDQREQTLGERRWAVPVLVLFAIGEAAAAVWLTPWFWLAVALFVGAAASAMIMPNRLARRAELLQDPHA